jgi:hypothetical protein
MSSHCEFYYTGTKRGGATTLRILTPGVKTLDTNGLNQGTQHNVMASDAFLIVLPSVALPRFILIKVVC